MISMLPRYRSHKEVHAAEITRVRVGSHGEVHLELKEANAWCMPPEWVAKHMPAQADGGVLAFVGGYLVAYDDGAYVSWSPKAAFEQGYRPIVPGTQGVLFEHQGEDPIKQVVRLIDEIRQRNTLPVDTDDVRLKELFKEINDMEGVFLGFIDVAGCETDSGLKSDKRWLSIARTHLEQGFVAIREAFTRANRR